MTWYIVQWSLQLNPGEFTAGFIAMVSVFIKPTFTSEWGLFTFSCSDWLVPPFPPTPSVDGTVCSYNLCKSYPVDGTTQVWQPWPAVGGCPGLPARSLPLCSSLRDAVAPQGHVSVLLASSEQLSSTATTQMLFPVTFSSSSQRHRLMWKRSSPCPGMWGADACTREQHWHGLEMPAKGWHHIFIVLHVWTGDGAKRNGLVL